MNTQNQAASQLVWPSRDVIAAFRAMFESNTLLGGIAARPNPEIDALGTRVYRYWRDGGQPRITLHRSVIARIERLDDRSWRELDIGDRIYGTNQGVVYWHTVLAALDAHVVLCNPFEEGRSWVHAGRPQENADRTIAVWSWSSAAGLGYALPFGRTHFGDRQGGSSHPAVIKIRQ